MFGFIKKILVVTITFFNEITLSLTLPKCVSMNNQECKVKSKVININSNKHLFYRYSVKIDKCSGSCNNIND